MAKWTSNYIGTWGFELEVTTSVSGLKGTVSYKVTTCRMENGSFNTRTHCWCKVYRDTSTLLDTYDKTTEATGLGVTVISGSYTIDLNSETGKGSTTIRLEGNYGNATHSVVGVSIANQTISISGGWSAVGKGTVTVKDNYNNTFTITATKGSNDATGNNIASGPSNLKYGYSATTRNTAYTNKAATKLTINGTADARTVYAEATTKGSKGGDAIATGQEVIRQYIAPSAPGTPVLAPLTKNKLTIKEPWTFVWTHAAPKNAHSTVVGYRIHLYRIRAGVEEALIIKDANGNVLSTWDANYNKYVYDRDLVSNSITIYPEVQEFLPGDKVKLGIHSYTRFGENNDMAGSENALFNTGQIYSVESEVQKAAQLRINTPDGWKEGQAFVMTKNGWKEASSIYVNTEKGWKEPK